MTFFEAMAYFEAEIPNGYWTIDVEYHRHDLTEAGRKGEKRYLRRLVFRLFVAGEESIEAASLDALVVIFDDRHRPPTPAQAAQAVDVTETIQIEGVAPW